MIKDWKLKLRYGRLKTPFTHYTLIAPARVEKYIEDFDAEIGKAWIGMKIWRQTKTSLRKFIKVLPIKRA